MTGSVMRTSRGMLNIVSRIPCVDVKHSPRAPICEEPIGPGFLSLVDIEVSRKGGCKSAAPCSLCSAISWRYRFVTCSAKRKVARVSLAQVEETDKLRLTVNFAHFCILVPQLLKLVLENLHRVNYLWLSYDNLYRGVVHAE
jgi:hypothetical protein